MTVLKVNSMYQTDGGYLIIRSHFSKDKANQWCVVEELKGGFNHFVKSHRTMNKKELKKALDLTGKEQIVIL